MGKRDYEIGSSTIENFFNFMKERHSIWHKRFVLKQEKPWTKDTIFQRYKFTNVFRELDTGTIHLREALRHETLPSKIIFNVIWYRLFNWWEHIVNLGPIEIDEYQKLEDYLLERNKNCQRIFTSAHMTHGEIGEDKVITYLRITKDCRDYCFTLAGICSGSNSMEEVFKWLIKIPMVGPFIGYEIVCDLRFTPALTPTDSMTWANIGPGAKRGLERLGMEVSLESMIYLLSSFIANEFNNPLFEKHFIGGYPPFELREIEHSLCEFDKYERVRLGQGTPRQKYNGI